MQTGVNQPCLLQHGWTLKTYAKRKQPDTGDGVLRHFLRMKHPEEGSVEEESISVAPRGWSEGAGDGNDC